LRRGWIWIPRQIAGRRGEGHELAVSADGGLTADSVPDCHSHAGSLRDQRGGIQLRVPEKDLRRAWVWIPRQIAGGRGEGNEAAVITDGGLTAGSITGIADPDLRHK